jgi:hypothetical protein
VGEFVNNYLSRWELDPDDAHDLAIKSQPLLGLYGIEKSRGSESVTVRFVLRGPRGFARTLAQAQQKSNIKRNSEYFRFTVPYGRMEGSILFSLEELVKAEADPEYGADLLDTNMESGIAGFAQEIVYQLNGTLGGSFGQATFNATASGAFPVYSLRFSSTPEVLGRLQNGDQVEVSTADGTSTSDTTLAMAGVVIDRDTDNGYLQIAPISAPSTAGNPGGWDDTGATTYYVYMLGAMQSGVPDGEVVPWSAYVPSTRSTGTLYGVNRGADAFLSGARLLSSEATGTYARRMKKLVAKCMNRLGDTRSAIGKTQKLVLNPEDWDTFEDQQNARVGREVEKVAIDGYEAIQVRTSMGVTDVIAEPSQLKGTARLVSPKVIRLASMTGKIVNLVSFGMGNGMLVAKPSSNDFEARPFWMGQHVVGPPHAHGIFSLA